MRTLLAMLSLMIALAINLVVCSSNDRMSGEVFWIGGDVDLPNGAVLRVALSDVSFADAAAIVVAEQLIEDVDSLPQRFSFSFDSGQIEQRNEYSLSARVELDGQLLYINDTVHSVLTGGGPGRSDVAVVSVNSTDPCREPLPGSLGFYDDGRWEGTSIPAGAVATIRLLDVSDPDSPTSVTETVVEDLTEFPIEFELPHDGVSVDRHHRYELEATITLDGQVLFDDDVYDAQRMLPFAVCPSVDRPLLIEVFRVGE